MAARAHAGVLGSRAAARRGLGEDARRGVDDDVIKEAFQSSAVRGVVLRGGVARTAV